MTTDTKAVARWAVLGPRATMGPSESGEVVLFTDHERVVGELYNQLSTIQRHAQERADEDGNEIETLRTALAASRAEVEGLKKDAERYRWLRNPNTDVGLVIDKVTGEIPYDEGTRTGGYHTYEYRAGEELDTAIDATMEKGNV